MAALSKNKFDLGREDGTWMPPRWAASGARYEFSLDVKLGGSASVAAAAEKEGAASVAAWFDSRAARGSRSASKETRRDKYLGGDGSGGVVVLEGRQPTRPKIRNYPAPFTVVPGCWTRAGKVNDGSLKLWMQVGDEGVEFEDLALPPGERLFMTAPAWGRTLSNRGGVVSVRVNAIWRTEYRIVGRWKAVPIEQ